MDDEKLCKGSSIQSNVKALNESVKGKHSQKRMRDESADASSDQDVHISDKKDQKRNRLLDAQGGKSQIVKRTSESQESHVQNKANEFVRTMSDDGNEIFRRAKRRIPVIQRSLAIVLASLLGVQIIIELKNDSEVTGTVDETDASMNVTLIDVRKVRYIH